jgi:parallel beta-helix repeat protein
MTAVRTAGGTDAGRVRENNEDRFHVDAERGIYVVVDGVGGQAGGETAAETALLQLRSRLERASGSAEERLREAITLANNEVYRLSRTNAEWTGMACVLTAAVVDGPHLTVGHVGDSRLYKLRQGRIEKLTHDHSPVGEREDSGELDETEAMRHPRRNEVFRDIGSERHTPTDADFIEIVTSSFEPDAALLLCSDGLSDVVTSRQMLEIIASNAGSPDAVIRQLIAEANQNGGKDNITVVYVEGERFAMSAARRALPGPRTRGRLVATHAIALMLGVVLGAVALTFVPGWIATVLPGSPVTAVTEPLRVPKTLIVQQASAAGYATIANALAEALPGDVVLVGPGEYRERLTLRTGVTLASEIRHRAIIRVPDSEVQSAAVIADGVRDARLEGFQILGEQQRMQIGVLVLNGTLILEDTRISGATDAGVDLWGGTSVTLRANDIVENTGVGVRLRSAAQSQLLHNRIVRNGRGSPAAPGVLLDPGAMPLLMGNVIAENGAQGIAGVTPRDRADILRHNVFVADARSNGQGAVGMLGPAAPARR